MAYITEATAGAGWSGTVSVSYNGVVIATKSGTISGLPAKLVGSALVVGHTNATVDTAIAYQVYDAAGNVVPVAPASIALSTSDNTSAVTGIQAASGGTTWASNSSSGSGYLRVVGGTTAGTANLVLKTTLSNGAVISSNSFPVLVGGASASYTASFDKSSYNQGDIATLTVKFLDSKGNAAASDSVNYSVASATSGWNASLSTPMLTQVGGTGGPGTTGGYTTAAPVVSNASGVVTIKYTVGTPSGVTAGAYNAIVDFPSVDAVAGSSQTVAYTVATGGTSLNDVLKGIVSLIASINKQIAALAKLVSPAKKK
jgi:hypothetical protein